MTKPNQFRQRKEEMPKNTTNEDTILEMALVGYELQRNRIEAAMKDIRAELGSTGSSRSNSADPPQPNRRQPARNGSA